MPQNNVEIVNIINEADLTSVASPLLTDKVHLTQGREAELSAIKTTILAGESLGDTDISVIQTATQAEVNSSTGTNGIILSATPTVAGVMSAADKDKLDGLSNGGGITNLDYTSAPTEGTVTSDTGTDATLPIVSGVNAGLMSPAQNTKLDGIEALADVTDFNNVVAAGAVMLVDVSTINMDFVVDEDDMVSDSDTKIPTQQSVKAYVDAQVGGPSSQSFTDSLLIGPTRELTLTLENNTFYEVTALIQGTNVLDLIGDNLTNGDFFFISNNTGADLDVDGISNIAFSDIENPSGSGTFIRLRDNSVYKFIVKEAGFGTFYYPVYRPLLDEDNMDSDSPNFAATQQSVKAYVDAQVSGAGSQNFTATIFVSTPTVVTQVLAKDTFYNVENISGGTNSVNLDGTSLTNGDTFVIANNTGNNLSLLATGVTISFTNIRDSNSSSSSLQLKDGTAYQFVIKESGTGAFCYPLNAKDIFISGRLPISGSFTSLEAVGSIALDADTLTLNPDVNSSLATIAVKMNDDDTFANATNDTLASSESIKAYVDANSGGTLMSKYKVLNAQFHAKPGITFTSSAGAGLLTIPTFGDISSATIPLISGTDYAINGDYTLTIKWTDNSVNTWTSTAVGDIDLYVPSLKFYDIGGHIAFDTQGADSKNALAGAIDPSFDFDNGEIRFKFTNASNFGSFPQLLCQIHFATL